MNGNGAATATPVGGTSVGKRADPATGAYFSLELTGVGEVGAFVECSGLQVEFEVFEYQEGGENGYVHKFRGHAKYPNIVLKRGVTNQTALFDWFKKAQQTVERKDGSITLLDYAGRPVRRWSFTGAFPVKWQGPTLKANSTEAATETLEFAHNGLDAAR